MYRRARLSLYGRDNVIVAVVVVVVVVVDDVVVILVFVVVIVLFFLVVSPVALRETQATTDFVYG